MGLIICEKHGRQHIVQVSNILYGSFINQKKETILRLNFNIEELKDNSLVHYFSMEENTSQFESGMVLSVFEKEFSKNSSDPVICEKCFEEYIDRSNSEILNKEIVIK